MKISHGDSYLAEEMVQTVFLKVWKNREQLDPKLSFGAYLCTIAKNLLTNHYQHKMMEILYIEQQIDHPGTPYARGTDEVVEYHLLEEFVDSLIQQMPEGRQRIPPIQPGDSRPIADIREYRGIPTDQSHLLSTQKVKRPIRPRTFSFKLPPQ